MTPIVKTDKHFKHYASCTKSIETCIICRFVWGNLSQEEQQKHKKELEN